MHVKCVKEVFTEEIRNDNIRPRSCIMQCQTNL